MIIWDKRNGYSYEDEQTHKRYSLYEAECYKGEATSDILIIWDEELNRFTNYVYGASTLFENLAELDDTIRQYVDDHKKLEPTTKIVYPLTKAGVSAWCSDVVDDILEREICCDYIISHGNRFIKIPDLAEIHGMLENFLAEAEEEGNE